MKRLTMWLGAAAIVLGCGPAALAQEASCNQASLRGVWLLTCDGFTDLSKINPAVAPGTLVPVTMQARMVIDESGKGKGAGVGSLGGLIFSFDKQETFTVNSDCTAQKAYTLSVPELGLVLPGKASSVFVPRAREISTVILQTGDVVTCRHRKMFNEPGPPQ